MTLHEPPPRSRSCHHSLCALAQVIDTHAEPGRCGSSFQAIIVSEEFNGKPTLARHRYEYAPQNEPSHIFSCFLLMYTFGTEYSRLLFRLGDSCSGFTIVPKGVLWLFVLFDPSCNFSPSLKETSFSHVALPDYHFTHSVSCF